MAEPLWGDGADDHELEERDDQIEFWEHDEQISELREDGKRACWSCGDAGHQRRDCPLRRRGDQGRKLVLNLKQLDPEHLNKNDKGRRSHYNSGYTTAQRYKGGYIVIPNRVNKKIWILRQT